VLFTDWLRTGTMTPALVIFEICSSHWQERRPKEVLALGITSEIYLLEHVLQVSVAMVTSELR
jgi:hypothetical protein